MPDRSVLTAVSDSTLLPFGENQIANTSNNVTSRPFDISSIFDGGINIGNRSYDRLRVETDGRITLRNAELEDAYNEGIRQNNFSLPNPTGRIEVISNFRTRLDVIGEDEQNAGVFVDLNEERDSVIVSFSSVPWQIFAPDITTADFPRASAQLELVDIGDGNVEVIWRFADLPDNGRMNQPIIFAPGFQRVFRLDQDRAGPSLQLDTNLGNTGIEGVWQMRLLDGQLAGSDLAGDTITGEDDAGDMIIGTSGGDLIGGRGGDDTIRAGYGDDTLFGGEGNDTFIVEGGANRVTGAAGNDTITLGDGRFVSDAQNNRLPTHIVDAGEGDDSVTSGNLSDSIAAGAGDDFVAAGGGDNTVNGGDGNDTITATSEGFFQGHNVITGGAGEDEITTDQGSDSIDGGTGASTIRSGEGDDTIRTHDAADFVNAGNGNDDIRTFLGDDTIRLGGEGRSTVQAGGGDDLVDGSFVERTFTYRDTGIFASGQEGEDTLIGSNNGDTLAGQDGNDSILSGSGEDEVHGGEGNDVLAGGYGNDRMFGGDGDDFIFSSLGADTVSGGAGADRFFSSGLDQDFMHILDYNPDEGDRLVMDNRDFDPGDFELRYLTALTVNGPVYRQIQLGWQAEDGYRGLFTFQNEPDITEILLRLSSPDEVELVRFDLIPL